MKSPGFYVGIAIGSTHYFIQLGRLFLWHDGFIYSFSTSGKRDPLTEGYWSTKREAREFLADWLTEQMGYLPTCVISTSLQKLFGAGSQNGAPPEGPEGVPGSDGQNGMPNPD